MEVRLVDLHTQISAVLTSDSLKDYREKYPDRYDELIRKKPLRHYIHLIDFEIVFWYCQNQPKVHISVRRFGMYDGQVTTINPDLGKKLLWNQKGRTAQLMRRLFEDIKKDTVKKVSPVQDAPNISGDDGSVASVNSQNDDAACVQISQIPLASQIPRPVNLPNDPCGNNNQGPTVRSAHILQYLQPGRRSPDPGPLLPAKQAVIEKVPVDGEKESPDGNRHTRSHVSGSASDGAKELSSQPSTAAVQMSSEGLANVVDVATNGSSSDEDQGVVHREKLFNPEKEAHKECRSNPPFEDEAERTGSPAASSTPVATRTENSAENLNDRTESSGVNVTLDISPKDERARLQFVQKRSSFDQEREDGAETSCGPATSGSSVVTRTGSLSDHLDDRMESSGVNITLDVSPKDQKARLQSVQGRSREYSNDDSYQWADITRIEKRDVKIPREQRILLEDFRCWMPPEPQKNAPRGLAPAVPWSKWHAIALRRQNGRTNEDKGDHPRSQSRERETSLPEHPSDSGSDEGLGYNIPSEAALSSNSGSQATRYSWSPSPPRAAPRIPDDSPIRQGASEERSGVFRECTGQVRDGSPSSSAVEKGKRNVAGNENGTKRGSAFENGFPKEHEGSQNINGCSADGGARADVQGSDASTMHTGEAQTFGRQDTSLVASSAAIGSPRDESRNSITSTAEDCQDGQSGEQNVNSQPGTDQVRVEAPRKDSNTRGNDGRAPMRQSAPERGKASGRQAGEVEESESDDAMDTSIPCALGDHPQTSPSPSPPFLHTQEQIQVNETPSTVLRRLHSERRKGSDVTWTVRSSQQRSSSQPVRSSLRSRVSSTYHKREDQEHSGPSQDTTPSSLTRGERATRSADAIGAQLAGESSMVDDTMFHSQAMSSLSSPGKNNTQDRDMDVDSSGCNADRAEEDSQNPGVNGGKFHSQAQPAVGSPRDSAPDLDTTMESSGDNAGHSRDNSQTCTGNIIFHLQPRPTYDSSRNTAQDLVVNLESSAGNIGQAVDSAPALGSKRAHPSSEEEVINKEAPSKRRRHDCPLDEDNEKPDPMADILTHRENFMKNSSKHPQAQTVHEKFQSDYPSYAGDFNHFVELCWRLQCLRKKKELRRSFLWDDFIIMNLKRYPEYVRRCRSTNTKRMEYEDYFLATFRKPAHKKRSLTLDRLEMSAAQYGLSGGSNATGHAETSRRSPSDNVNGTPSFTANRPWNSRTDLSVRDSYSDGSSPGVNAQPERISTSQAVAAERREPPESESAQPEADGNSEGAGTESELPEVIPAEWLHETASVELGDSQGSPVNESVTIESEQQQHAMRPSEQKRKEVPNWFRSMAHLALPRRKPAWSDSPNTPFKIWARNDANVLLVRQHREGYSLPVDAKGVARPMSYFPVTFDKDVDDSILRARRPS